jgi:hypothetical protein
MAENSDEETIRRTYHYRCIICRQPEKVTGRLILVQVGENPEGSKQVIPMCPVHHLKYIQGYCTNAELKKIGISREAYQKNMSAISQTGDSCSPLTTTEKTIAVQQDTIKKIEKAQKKRFQQIQSDYKKEI